ncbi:MAG: hypothetical protein ACAI38_09590, partial [Myxococcota bacterium]
MARGSSRTAAAGRQALFYGVGATGTTGVMVNWEMAERYLAGRPINLEVYGESVQRNAILTTSVMGVGLGLSRLMPGLSPQALVAAANAPRLIRQTGANAADVRQAIAQPETAREPVAIVELQSGGDRYRVRDDATIVSDSGQRYRLRTADESANSFVASDEATGALYIFEPGASGNARFRRAGAIDFTADGRVGVVDGVPVSRLPNGVLVSPELTPVGLMRAGAGPATLAQRFGAVDAYTRSLLAAQEPLSAITLPNGRVAHTSSTHFVTPEGRVLRSFAQDARGRRVVVDAEGAGYLVEADGSHRPITQASAAADGLAGGFQREAPPSLVPLFIRNMRARGMLDGLSPEVANILRFAMPGFSFDAGLLPRPVPGIDLRVRNGRLVQVASRGSHEVAFDVNGLPVEILPGDAPPPSRVQGIGPNEGTPFTVRQDGGKTSFWAEVSGNDGSIHRAADGTHAILRRNTDDPPQRTGVLSVGLPTARRVTHLLVDGELFLAGGSVQGQPHLVYATSATRDGLFRVQGSGPTATPVPVQPRGTVRVVNDFGATQRVYHDGSAYSVIAEPLTRTQFADSVFHEMVRSAAVSPDVSVVASLTRVMLPESNGRYAIRPELSEPGPRLTALRNELIAGRGPLVEAALGRDGMARLEAEVGFTPSDVMPFVLAVQSDVPPGLRGLQDAWSPSVAFRPQRFGIFVNEGSTLRPATTGEVRTTFDRAVGTRSGTWRDLPRPDSVAIQPGTPGGATRNLVIRRGEETITIPFGDRPSGAAPGLHPTDTQIVRWFRGLPFQSLRGLENVGFSPDTVGLASYADMTRTVNFHAHPTAWRGGFADVIAGHEIAGHNVERGSPTLMKMLVLSAVLDRAAASPHAARLYGEVNPREYFATLVERYIAGDPTVAQRWPHFDRIMGAMFTPDGRATPNDVFRGGAQAVLPVALLAIIAAEREKETSQ